MKYILAFMFMTLLLSGCKKEEENNPSVATSKLSGHVKFTSATASPIYDFQGIAVTVTSNNGSWQATTNTAGYYEINDLPIGLYDITYEAAGYGTLKAFSLAHTGYQNQYIGVKYLYQIPADEIVSPTIEAIFNSPWLEINAQTKLAGNHYYTLFIGANSGFKISESLFINYLQSNDNKITANNYYQNLSGILASGDTAFGYLYPSTWGAHFTNYTTPQGETVYPGLGKQSPEFFFVIP